ncbi:M6 family metalloprotease domain-containing protein [Massilia sp. PAMC28688]|uniref:M6 family metalloprotease domain-containing protein n=1 Tax=Massilia sp. PAMC28688 TaxID=2861283 RepID=UPI001C633CB0|nr:M6 family metalloprotease domain-containing protein [Massilia sp. PAMC28688]QYF94862.1 M6 family metalloprotease domain-containing protein [Massilia sp. PAMC28688]
MTGKTMRLAAALLLAVASLGVQAGIPYNNHAYNFQQPSGEVLRVLVDGNDYYAEERTADGALIIYDPAKKGFCYAHVNAAGTALVSTGVLASNAQLRSMNGKMDKQPGLSTAAKALKARQRYQKLHGHAPEAANDKLRKASTQAASTGMSPMAVATGAMRGLTVIIDFSDAPATISQAQVSSFLNDVPYTGFGNAQSVRGYFQSVSGGKLDYQNTVTRYYRARRPKSYYADASLDSGVRSQELITEALNWLKAQNFDFATLSRDSYNRIKGLNFFYAGQANSPWAKGLWPHMGTLWPQFCSNGICTNTYQISDMGPQLAIGTFAHETGHLLMDWPDLYDYDGSSEGSVADFCLMGTGGVGYQSQFRPVPPNGFFRYLSGWASVTELNPAINRTPPTGRLSHTSGSHSLYRWSNPGNPSEAFYVEALHKSDQNLYQPDQGLAIFHTDPSGDNSSEWKPYVQMEHADGRRDPEYNVNRGDATDLFDGAATKSFSDTLPNALTARGTNSKWSNGYGSGLALHNISTPARTISFDVGAAGAGVSYTGSLAAGARVIHPAPWFEYAGGTIKATLIGPSTADFDLLLERWNGSAWAKAAASESHTSSEVISYAASAGYYRITVYSYSGSGAYKLLVYK